MHDAIHEPPEPREETPPAEPVAAREETLPGDARRAHIERTGSAAAEGAQASSSTIASDRSERAGDLKRTPLDPELVARLQGERDALGRLASAVARGVDLGGICHAVAREAANGLGVDVGVVYRFEGGVGTIAGRWLSGRLVPQPALPLVGAVILAEIARTGTSAHRDGVAGSPIVGPRGIWGAALVTAAGSEPLPTHATARLAAFLELAGLVIIGAADRARLMELGAPDPVTGLIDRRNFDARLVAEIGRARRHGYPLAVAVLEIDRFSGILTRQGYQLADHVLRRVADCLGDAAREDDLIARLGGAQFAWLLAYSDSEGAERAAERLCAAIAGCVAADIGAITVSIGICDVGRMQDPDEVLGLARAALAKARDAGGNTVRYAGRSLPGAATVPTHAADSPKPGTPASVYALSRAVDIKDPSTHGHSRRVADLAGHLARTLGWTPGRVRLLREAGLLYDVGKSHIPDAILLKSEALTPQEYDLMRTHAARGAQLVEGILTDDQVRWIRHHHERWDGRGYPDGLAGAQIPDGARILAAADSWDVMTTGRPYKTALTSAEALAECRRLAGSQFCPEVVAALGTVLDVGALAEDLSAFG